jgi:hypothetical protein
MVSQEGNARGALTMAEHALGVVGKHPLNLDRGIPAMGKQQLERVFAPRSESVSASAVAGSPA